MKKMYFLLLPVLIYACSGVEQYKAGIEELAKDWDSATSKVTEFSSTIGTDMSTFSQMASSLNLGDDVLNKLKPEQVTEWQGARGTFAKTLMTYAPIRTKVGEFTKVWGEKTAEVQALKDGLAAGKLEGDIMGQLAGLTTLVTQAKESLAGWQTEYDSAKSQTQTAADALKSLHGTLIASAASAKK